MSKPVLAVDSDNAEGVITADISLKGDQRDGIHVRVDCAEIADCRVEDQRDENERCKAHCDAIQLIASDFLVKRGWFAASMLTHATVRNCHILAKNSLLQGITGFDGLFAGIRVIDNTIETDSVHKITFNGLLAGEVRGNKDGDGNVIPAVLYPLRIGGGEDGEPKVWVIGFADSCEVSYRAVEGDVVDNRRYVFNDHDVFLDQFDLNAFRDVAAALHLDDAADHARTLRELALKFGRVVGRSVKDKNDKPVQSGGVIIVSDKGKNRKIFDPLSELGLVQSGAVPVGILFNNPMAVKNYERWQHDIARSDWPDFMRGRREDLLRFDNPRWGIRCGVHLLLGYQQSRGLSTIRQLISTWAPCKGKDADNTCESTRAYIEHVSMRVGVRPDAVVAVRDYDTIRKIVVAMIEYENGWLMPYSDEIIDDGLAYAGIKMPGESRPEVKPKATSKERTGAILVGGGGVTAVVTDVLTKVGVSKESAGVIVGEAGKVLDKVDTAAVSMDWVFWLTIFNSFCWVLVVAGAAWWWKGRNMAGRLLLR